MIRKKIDILIFVEHRSRELETAALLKVLFEEKGFSVAVESLQFNREAIMLKYYPKYVIVPWVYGEREVQIWSFLNLFRRKNPISLMSMHHEQLTNEGSLATLLPQGRAKYTYHLCWGDQFAEQLLSCGCSEDTLIKAGNVRLDFYKKRLRGLTIENDNLYNKYGFERGKKIVLFIANAFHLMKPEEIKTILNRGTDMEEQREKSIKCRQDFLNYVNDYLSNTSDTIFIYRPHPCHDSREIMREEIQYLIKKYPSSFYCISDGPIRDWILNCDVCMTFHSTSAIECYFANVPFYLVRTVNLSPEKDYSFFNHYKFIISDYETFCAALKTETIDYSEFAICLSKELYLERDVLFAQKLVEEVAKEMISDRRTFDVEPDIATLISSFARLIAKEGIYIAGHIPFIRNALIKYNNGKTFNPLRIGADYWTNDDLLNLCNNIKRLNS